jgi:hypothetical protein
VTIGRRSNAPVFVVLPPPLEAPIEAVETVSSRPQALLPSVDDPLPKVGTPQFARRMREMGLNPTEVGRFAQMMRTQDLTAFRK